MYSHLGDRPAGLSYWLAFSVRASRTAGSSSTPASSTIRRGEVWRLVTPIFLHWGMAHLFFNMLALLALGERIEFRKGTWRLAVFVLVTAVASNVGQFYKSGGSFGGMSGVVFAMAGYLWIKGQVHPEDGLSLDQRSMTYMVAWFLLGIAFGEFGPPGRPGLPLQHGQRRPRGRAGLGHGPRAPPTLGPVSLRRRRIPRMPSTQRSVLAVVAGCLAAFFHIGAIEAIGHMPIRRRPGWTRRSPRRSWPT